MLCFVREKRIKLNHFLSKYYHSKSKKSSNDKKHDYEECILQRNRVFYVKIYQYKTKLTSIIAFFTGT